MPHRGPRTRRLGWIAVAALLALGVATVHARTDSGRVDGVVPEEGRLVIDDGSYLVTEDTAIHDLGGERVPLEALPEGAAVRFEYDARRRTLQRVQVIPPSQLKRPREP